MKRLLVLLALVVVVLPLVTVQIIPTDCPQPYVFQARILEKLEEVPFPRGEGGLRYFLVEQIKGDAPDDKFVALICSSYTRGSSTMNFEIDEELWMQGALMTPEAFYGEQYLFFDDYSSLYIRQVKNKGFWPDQLTELRILYRSPFTSFYYMPYAFLYPFVAEGRDWLRTYVFVIARAALVVLAVFFLIKNRHKKQSLALIALTYSLLAMALTIPILTDMY